VFTDNNIGDENMKALSSAFSTRPPPAIDDNSITAHTHEEEETFMIVFSEMGITKK